MKQDSAHLATCGRNNSETRKVARGDQTQGTVHFVSKLMT
jgi:hypothetical protein